MPSGMVFIRVAMTVVSTFLHLLHTSAIGEAGSKISWEVKERRLLVMFHACRVGSIAKYLSMVPYRVTHVRIVVGLEEGQA